MPVSAQAWTAQLVLSPVPSPYLSDWELDPTIGQLIVGNHTSATTDVTFHYTLTRSGQVLLRGTTDPQTVAANQSVVFTAASSFGGRADWSRDVQQQIARTGRLPEGEYEACVTIAGPGGEVLVPRQCVRFTTQSSDPPFLVFPANGDTLTSRDPIFEWQPVQVPPAADARIGYVLQIAEVRTAARQQPEVALESNILHYVEPNLVQTSHQYPIGALPLVSGRTYAWRVQALDGDGKPAAANQGRSEIWTFVYRESEAEVTRAVARLELTPRRDTLRYAGDTARYEVTAYDADNVEIRGKRAKWRAVDSTIARVDSTGVVTGVRVGETQIVATVDGVADSALSVTTVRTFAVRFERYDAQTDKPTILELIKSGSFEEIAEKLTELFESGELHIPIPRLPGVEGASSGPGDEEFGGARGGPSAAFHELPTTRVADDCDGVSGIADVHLDRERKVWALQLGVTTAVIKCLLQNKGTATDTTLHASAVLAVSLLHPGFPRVFLALKQIRNLPLPIPLPFQGMDAHTRFIVLNPTPSLASIELKSDLLPVDFKGFFGTDEFTAGPGLTVWSKHRCTNPSSPAPTCLALRAMAYDEPEIVVRMFAGVNASETSADFGSGVGVIPKRGHSLALGFSIQAVLPVRRWRNAPTVAGFKLDSTQVGLLFSVQDSITPRNTESQHNWSVGLAPTATVWFTGPAGNSWEFNGSIGVEVDPTKPRDQAKKLVIAGSIGAIWKLWYVRLGNPQYVITRMLEEQGTIEVALSGTWGVGPWDSDKPAEAVGLDTLTAGAGVPGDIGGAAFAAGSGIQEMGRGAVILKWEKPKPKPAPPADNRTEYEKAQETLREAKRNYEHYKSRADRFEKNCEDARSASNAALDNAYLRQRKELECEGYAGALRLQSQALAEQTAASDALTNFRRAADPAAPAGCTGTSRCYSWSANLSFNNGALVDVLAMLFRMIPGVP